MNSKTKTYIIEQEDSGQRIDAFLANIYSDLSRSYVQKQIKLGNVKLNGAQIKPSQQLRTDDKLVCTFEEESINEILPQNIPLDIKYEDNSMLIVNKPSGMLTHPTSIERTNTLVNALLYHTNGCLCTCNGADRPGIVHRLDRNTSGLLMIAKCDESFDYLKKQIQNRTIEKKYFALVSGDVKDDNGTIIADIGRHPTRPEKMSVVSSGKPSVTHYTVIERFDKYTLLDITLETGRTHQIRVHMAHIGHPIVNDTMYGSAKIPVKTNEQALQAYSLKFVSPDNKAEQWVEIPMDDDIIRALNYLRSKK